MFDISIFTKKNVYVVTRLDHSHDSSTMELLLTLEITKRVKKLKGVKYDILLNEVFIYVMYSIWSICNKSLKQQRIIPKIASSVVWMLSTMSLKSSIRSKFLVNFIVLSIMQTTCNTHILVGVAGSSSSGSSGNGTTTDANAPGGSILE